VTLYWQHSYLPPSASTFTASGSKHPVNHTVGLGENNGGSKSSEEKSRKNGIKSIYKSNIPNDELNTKENFKANSKPNSPTEQEFPAKISSMNNNLNPSLTNIVRESINLEKEQNKTFDLQKRNSITSHDEVSMGNSTIHSKPEKLPQLKISSKNTKSASFQKSLSNVGSVNSAANTHYNDTMFGDEHVRTYSPNELDSLRNVYQNNVVNQSDEEIDFKDQTNDASITENQNFNNDRDFEEGEDEFNEESENIKDGSFRNYNATRKSEDDVIVDNKGSWDPNGTRALPKEGDENNVIIEISNFTLKENSQVLKKDEIQQLFVGMEFLSYDPVELESKNSMPKPVANQPVHFNFRKSIFF